MTDAIPPLEASEMEQIGGVLADIAGAVHMLLSMPEHDRALSWGFQYAFAARDALQHSTAGHLTVPARVVSIILTALAHRLSLTEAPQATIGCIFVSAVTDLESCADDHPERARIDELLMLAASVAALVEASMSSAPHGIAQGDDPAVQH